MAKEITFLILLSSFISPSIFTITIGKEIAFEMPPYFRIFTDGSIQRNTTLSRSTPVSDHPVRSKDVLIPSGISVRIFAPPLHHNPPQKIPLVVYIHGGSFCMGSPSSPPFHTFVSNLVQKGNLIAVSVDYRLAPENPLPIPFDDSWFAFQWIASRADPWLNDVSRVFVGGESSGATIANDIAIRAGVRGVKIDGLFLLHPFFGGKEVDKLYKILCPASSGRDDDPRLNPAVDPRIGKMAGRRVMFFVAEKDPLRERGRAYYEGLKKSVWGGQVEIMETKGEGHCFYLFDPGCDKAVAVLDRLIAFFAYE